jgi:hypothetical protein
MKDPDVVFGERLPRAWRQVNWARQKAVQTKRVVRVVLDDGCTVYALPFERPVPASLRRFAKMP